MSDFTLFFVVIFFGLYAFNHFKKVKWAELAMAISSAVIVLGIIIEKFIY